jgi:hypothetical protein
MRRRHDRSLDLFKDHPVVQSLLRAKRARESFLQFAESIQNGEPSPLPGYGASWFFEAAEDAEQIVVRILGTIHIDGEPATMAVL